MPYDDIPDKSGIKMAAGTSVDKKNVSRTHVEIDFALDTVVPESLSKLCINTVVPKRRINSSSRLSNRRCTCVPRRPSPPYHDLNSTAADSPATTKSLATATTSKKAAAATA